MARRRQHPGSRAGFTLMELMVVILVITVVTAMIIPELRGSFEEALLRSSARSLAGACDVAYSRAVAGGRTHRLRFDPGSGRFHVEADPSRSRSQSKEGSVDAPDATGTVDPRITVAFRRTEGPESTTTPRRPADAAGGDSIGFYADGTADPAEFLLQDRAGFRVALRVNPVTARVRIQDLGRP